MEVILEVVDAQGGRTRRRLDALPMTLGRGLANDVVLDDPYVDARHARLTRAESGELLIEDLGSVNGIIANGAKVPGLTQVDPGDVVRVGRTILRFRDIDEIVSPALVDDAVAERVAPERATPVVRPGRPQHAHAQSAATGSPTPILARLVESPAGRTVLATTGMAASAIYGWLSTSEGSSSAALLGGGFAFAMVTLIWAAICALVSRVAVHRAHFATHLAVISAMAIVALAWTIVGEWMEFFFPGSVISEVIGTAIAIAFLASLIAWHVSVSSTRPRPRHWQVGAASAAIGFAVIGLAALAVDDTFSDVATFSGVVKPVAAAWVPTTRIDDFSDVMRDLKKDVDEMAEKSAKTSRSSADPPDSTAER